MKKENGSRVLVACRRPCTGVAGRYNPRSPHAFDVSDSCAAGDEGRVDFAAWERLGACPPDLLREEGKQAEACGLFLAVRRERRAAVRVMKYTKAPASRSREERGRAEDVGSAAERMGRDFARRDRARARATHADFLVSACKFAHSEFTAYCPMFEPRFGVKENLKETDASYNITI